jgi:hypothetical protein
MFNAGVALQLVRGYHPHNATRGVTPKESSWQGPLPQKETEIQMSDQWKHADDVEAQILYVLTETVRIAAHQTLTAIRNRAEGGETDQLADLAYVTACLEGARRGVLPATPPPRRHSAPANALNDILGAEPTRRPTSSPQPGPIQTFGDTTRTNR